MGWCDRHRHPVPIPARQPMAGVGFFPLHRLLRGAEPSADAETPVNIQP